MKYSGIKWVGEIPDNWNIKAIRECLFERNEKNDKLQENTILSLSVKDGVTLYDGENHSGNKPREDLSGYKIVKENDIVANSMNILSGSVGLSGYNGVVSPVYYIYHIRNSKDSIRYFNYIFQCNEFQKNLRRLGKGILIRETEEGKLNTIRTKVPSYQLSIEKIPYPNEVTQKNIVKLLDKKTAEIDSLIEIEKKQIEKLKEYKQSVITEAVTRGIDNNAAMKDSGVEWLGKIPVDWNVCRFKNVITIANGKEIEADGGDIPVYGSGGIFKYTNKPLFNGTSLLLGRKGTIDNPMLVTGSFWTVDTMFYTSEIKNIDSKYLYYCAKGLINFDFYKSGSVLPSMTQTELNNIYITYPHINEQHKISIYLDKKCTEIDTLISIKRKKIDVLIEYKKSLIYEYVTGKKEVI